MQTWIRFENAALVVLLSANAALAAPAGRVLTAVGEVQAIRAGKTVTLARDSAIESGDAIRTGDAANAQLRLTDGSVIALRPDTQFVIEDYRFKGAESAGEGADDRGFFNLVKGGLRTITGLIGKKNRESYAMRTPTATMGIRGTHFNLVLCQQNCRNADGSLARDGLYGTVLDGAISVTNQAREHVFGKDAVFFVADAQSPAEKLLAPPGFLRDRLDGQARSRRGQQQAQETQQARTEGQQQAQPEAKPGPVEPPRVAEVAELPALALAKPQVVVTDELDKEGALAVLPMTTITGYVGAGNGAAPASGASSRFAIAEYSTGGSHNAFDSGSDTTLTTDAQGICTFMGGCFQRNTALVYESGADAGAIIWGRWAGGSMAFCGWGTQTFTPEQGQHIIYGVVPTTFPAMDAVTFGLIGATHPTETTNAATGRLWSVTGGSVTANFLSASYSGNLGLTVATSAGANTYGLAFNSSSLNPSSTNGWTGAVTHTGGSTNLCGTGCAANGTLIFAGTTATHAGTAYEFNLTTAGTYVQGAAVFKR